MAKDKNDQTKAVKNGGQEGGAQNRKSLKSKDDQKEGPGSAKKAVTKKAAKPAEKGPSFYQRTRQFFREVRIELKKVTWPSRKETIASTSVVIVLVFLIAVYLGVLDMILSRALTALLK